MNMQRWLIPTVLVGALALAGSAWAQGTPDFSKVEIKTTPLGHNTYMLEGQGGNITVAVGGDGVIMVDGEFAPLHDKIKAAITAITNEPIKYLINTHFHGDHTGGNAPFAKDGVTIVAQENVKKRLEEGTTNGLTGSKTPPADPMALPKLTYKTTDTIKVKGVTARLGHPKNAHTDGDTYVWFKDANVLATGDVFTHDHFPNIDFANGGSIKGMIAGADMYLKIANAKTKIVPGHGELATKADLEAYRTMLVTARDRIAKLIKEGKDEQAVIAAQPVADYAKKYAATDQQATNFARVIYHSLKS
jgi:glyoxylase-like metal-dependent hydrolase (beta-lactamase superfamily II)